MRFKIFLLLAMVVFIGCSDEVLGLGERNPVSSAQAVQLQAQSAVELGLEKEKTVRLDSKTNMVFMLIPAGEFHMGSPKSEKKRGPDEGPLHQVKISKPFYMGKFEVTQRQYKAVMDLLPKECKFGGANLPIENVDWNQANNFLRMLSAQHKIKFRLPTEAEWEYACRAGTNTTFNTGETISTKQANYDGRHVYGKGVKGQRLQRTTVVGSYKPNAFGLYDMHGNVWEWCRDRYKNYYYKRSPLTDPEGPLKGSFRIIRGGSWNHDPGRLRSADRNRRGPKADRRHIGFRAVLEIEE